MVFIHYTSTGMLYIFISIYSGYDPNVVYIICKCIFPCGNMYFHSHIIVG